MGIFSKLVKLAKTSVNPAALLRKSVTATRQDWQSVTGQSAARRAAEAAMAAQQDALAQQAEIAAVQAKQAESLRNMQANASADLRTDNLTSVVAGGTADLSTADTNSAVRKRKAGGGLASALGINV